MDNNKNEQAAQRSIEIIDECMKREVVTPLRHNGSSEKCVQEHLEQMKADGIRQQMKMSKKFSESVEKIQNRSSNDNIVVSILKSVFTKK